jgi:hypothetical protein
MTINEVYSPFHIRITVVLYYAYKVAGIAKTLVMHIEDKLKYYYDPEEEFSG